MDERYIQLIPINNVVAVYKDDDGSYFTLPCILVALTNTGNLVLFTLCSDGIIDADSANNFIEYVYLDDEGKNRISSFQEGNTNEVN